MHYNPAFHPGYGGGFVPAADPVPVAHQVAGYFSPGCPCRDVGQPELVLVVGCAVAVREQVCVVHLPEILAA